MLMVLGGYCPMLAFFLYQTQFVRWKKMLHFAACLRPVVLMTTFEDTLIVTKLVGS